MFGSGDVVNYRNEEWGDAKFWTYWEQRLFHSGKWFAGEVIYPFFLSTCLCPVPWRLWLLKQQVWLDFYLVGFGKFLDFFLCFVDKCMNSVKESFIIYGILNFPFVFSFFLQRLGIFPLHCLILLLIRVSSALVMILDSVKLLLLNFILQSLGITFS